MFGLHVSTPESARRALQAEDGRALRADLAGNLDEVAKTVLPDIRSGLMSVGHSGLPTVGQPLRSTVAQGLEAEKILTSRGTGTRIRMRKTPGLRGFVNAPKRLNQVTFRRRVFGRNTWTVQLGAANYFENPILRRASEFRNAAEKAIESMVYRIKRRTES